MLIESPHVPLGIPYPSVSQSCPVYNVTLVTHLKSSHVMSITSNRNEKKIDIFTIPKGFSNMVADHLRRADWSKGTCIGGQNLLRFLLYYFNPSPTRPPFARFLCASDRSRSSHSSFIIIIITIEQQLNLQWKRKRRGGIVSYRYNQRDGGWT